MFSMSLAVLFIIFPCAVAEQRMKKKERKEKLLTAGSKGHNGSH